MAFYCQSAAAQTAPYVGIVHNTSETSSLTYRCDPAPKNDVINCEFAQTSVRLKAERGDYAKRMTAAQTEFQSVKVSSDECAAFQEGVAILEGRKKAPKEETLASMSAIHRQDALAFGRALVALCDKRTLENYTNVIRIGFEKDTRCGLSIGCPLLRTTL
jgi:hypothetical protein